MPITKKAGSEDCTILMRRVVAHGGRAAYLLIGADQNGHHRADFDIVDEKSLPVGLGVAAKIIERLNGRR